MRTECSVKASWSRLVIHLDALGIRVLLLAVWLSHPVKSAGSSQ